MKSLKIAFAILLCVTILSVGASVVCAVIAGNTAESFRDYRSSVITVLSSLHAQLNSSKQAFADAMQYLDGSTQEQETKQDAATETLPAPDTENLTTEQDSTQAMQNNTPPAVQPEDREALYTVRKLDGRIGVYGADGTLLRTINVSVATLPRADREQLAAGIVLYSEQELCDLIEDFSG